jgi:hypothetical protein
MALATINSVATTKTLRSNLRELPTYCSTIKGDIELLHSYFDSNYTQIIARRATIDDPVDILFSMYMVVPCNNFRSYIKHKQDAYTDGTLTLTHEELIMLATNKFNLLKQEGMWGAKSPDKDKIVASETYNRKSHKAKGKAQPSWWEAGIWHKLLQNLRACGYMVHHPTSHCLCYPIQLGPLPS